MILVDQFYLHGGIEKLVSIKANYWAEKFGYKVIIVSPEQNNNETIYHLSDKVEFLDLNINYHRGISFFHPKNLSKLIDNFKKIKNAVATYSPDFILVASHVPMACGLPCVSFDCNYGPSDIISNRKDGYLVAQEDVDNLADSILNLIENKQLRKVMGKEGRENVKKYLPQTIVNEWNDLLKKL